MSFIAKQCTNSSYKKTNVQFQEIGDKIYFVWVEVDSSGYTQIWTAVMNINGTGWVATQRTATSSYNTDPQLQVVGTKIYYAWSEKIGVGVAHLWTAESNLDGTGWISTKRTTNMAISLAQMQVVDTKIYFVFENYDVEFGEVDIRTAEMNTDGTGWVTTIRSYSSERPQLQVVGTKVYYVWHEETVSGNRIVTAVMNTDGTGWSAANRTLDTDNYQNPQLQVVGTKIYYVWEQVDGSYHHIWTAEMNTDGTGWSATERTSNSVTSYLYPQLQVVGTKIYYVWKSYTATMNTDGTGWSATERTSIGDSPQLQNVGTIYFAWHLVVNGYEQIFYAEDGISVTDSGIGADIWTITDSCWGINDYGTGLDSSSLLASVFVSDSGIGTDLLSLLVSIALTDLGEGSDSGSIFFTASDLGSGADNFVITGISWIISDSGQGTDIGRLGVTYFFIDSKGVLSPLGVQVVEQSSQELLPKLKLYQEDIPGREGTIVFGSDYGARLIQLRVVKKLDPTVREMLKRNIARFLNPTKDAQPLVFENDPNRTYMVRYAGKIDPEQYPNYMEFVIPFKMTDPIIIGSFEQAKFGSGIINNEGNMLTPLIAEVDGPITDPNIVIGASTLIYAGTINDGSKLVIDTGALTVELDGINALPNYTGGFPKLPPGDTDVTASNQVTFRWRARWVG